MQSFTRQYITRTVLRSPVFHNQSTQRLFSIPQRRGLATVEQAGFPSKPNTIFNICPQGYEMIVERLGKFQRRIQPGWFIAVPFLDRIAYVVDMREMALRVEPQDGITRDNVSLHLSGNIYLRFVDVQKAAYGHQVPIYAVAQMAQAAMRAAVGKMDLDDIFHNREALNAAVLAAVREPSSKWGCDVFRYEVTDVNPDPTIQQSMDLQAAAERDRRSKVIEAEGIKQATVLRAESELEKRRLESEGLRIALVNEAEGRAKEIILAAEAKKEEIILHAQGYADQILLEAQAEAEAITAIAKAAQADLRSKEAMGLKTAYRFIEEFGKIGGRSTTMVIPADPVNAPSIVASASQMLQTVTEQQAAFQQANERQQSHC